MIAELAERQLSPAARQQVLRLLALEPGATLVSISTWADETRTKETAAWHYINFPHGLCSYDKARDCPTGDCVVEAIDAQVAILKSAAPDADRLVALKWVVHLIGDVHQPLHAGFGDDRGGNTFQLQAFDQGSNLHALWDSGLIANWPGGIAVLKEEVAGDVSGTLSSTAPAAASWAEESCRAVDTPGFYPDSRKVGLEYLQLQGSRLRTRLKAAALRLGAVLNDTLR